MKITLNGQVREFAEAEAFSVSGHPVLVELNGEALLKNEFDDREVADGATVEIVRMVAGG